LEYLLSSSIVTYNWPCHVGVVFSIHCYLIKMRELITVPKWARRLHRVLKGLHPALAEYNGLTRYRDTVVGWLSQCDDGAPTTPGTLPEKGR
jgi:hypothetical protein